MSTLTPKQAQFVREYLIDLNATQAAIRAGYSANGADTAGPRLLENPDVKAAIDCAKLQRSERTEITSDRVLEEISRMAFYEPGELMIDGDAGEDDHVSAVIDGRVIYGLRGPADVKRLPEKVRRAIVGWSYDRNQNFTVKLADKSKALDQLARHLGLYTEKVEMSMVDNFAERLERVASRTEECGIQKERQQRERMRSQILAEIASGKLIIPTPAPAPPPEPLAAPEPVKEAPAPKPPIPTPAPAYRAILPPYPETIGSAVTDYEPFSEN